MGGQKLLSVLRARRTLGANALTAGPATPSCCSVAEARHKARAMSHLPRKVVQVKPEDSPALLARGTLCPPALQEHCQEGEKPGEQLRQILHKHFGNKTALGVQFFSHYTLSNTDFKHIHGVQQRFQFSPKPLGDTQPYFFSYMT